MYIKHPIAGKCILVNYDEDIFRQNFTLAHEICHSLLDNDIDYNISLQSDKNNFREIRANEFASAFLIPNYIKERLQNIDITDQVLLDLSKNLRVSMQALLIALKNYNLVNQNQYNNFLKLKVDRNDRADFELHNLSDRIQEGKKKLLEMGLSSYYVRNCHEAYQQGIISAGKLSEMLLVSANEELIEILNLFKLKLNNEY